MPMWGYGISWPMAFGVLCVMLILSGFAGLLIWRLRVVARAN